MKRLVAVLALVLVSVPCAAQGLAPKPPEYGDRRLKPIDDPLRIAFMGDPGKLTKQQVQQAIEIAALAKDWKILNASDGRTELTTTKNGRHVLHVAVTYDAASCEIRYLGSTEMMYREVREKGRPVRVIHRNYNVWIRELSDAIGNKLGLPATVEVVHGAAARTVAAPKLAHNRELPPASGFAAIDDVDKVPVREAGKDRYRHYLTLQPPKAFVVTENGGWRIFFRNADAMAMALDHCETIKVGCWLYAVDDRVVFTADPGKRISRVSQLPRPTQ